MKAPDPLLPLWRLGGFLPPARSEFMGRASWRSADLRRSRSSLGALASWRFLAAGPACIRAVCSTPLGRSFCAP